MIDSFGTRHARSCQIAARERPRAGSKHMATFQAVAQTQSGCLIAARERPRAGSKQMATYQAPLPTTTQHPPLTDTDAHHTNEPNPTTTLPNPTQPNSRTRRNPPHLAPSLDTDRIEYRPRGMARRSGHGLPTGHRAGGK